MRSCFLHGFCCRVFEVFFSIKIITIFRNCNFILCYYKYEYYYKSDFSRGGSTHSQFFAEKQLAFLNTNGIGAHYFCTQAENTVSLSGSNRLSSRPEKVQNSPKLYCAHNGTHVDDTQTKATFATSKKKRTVKLILYGCCNETWSFSNYKTRQL